MFESTVGLIKALSYSKGKDYLIQSFVVFNGLLADLNDSLENSEQLEDLIFIQYQVDSCLLVLNHAELVSQLSDVVILVDHDDLLDRWQDLSAYLEEKIL